MRTHSHNPPGASSSTSTPEGTRSGSAPLGNSTLRSTHTGRLFRPGNDQTLVSRPGILGAGHGIGGTGRPRLHRLVATDWLAPAVLVMHTDGITSRWRLNGYPGADNHHPAILAALIWRDASRGNDDATVVVARTSPENGVR